MMDDVVRARVNEILNEKIAMGAGKKRRVRRAGAEGGARTIKPLGKIPQSVKVDYDELRTYLTPEEIACLVRKSKSMACADKYVSMAKRNVYRKGMEPVCTKGHMGTMEHAAKIHKALRRGRGEGEGGAEGGVSRKASKARKEFAHNAKEVGILMRQGYTRQQAWDIVKR